MSYFVVASTGEGSYAFGLSPDYASEFYANLVVGWSVWRDVNGGAIKVAECPTRESADAAYRLLRGQA